MKRRNKKWGIWEVINYTLWVIAALGSYFLVWFVVCDLYSVPATLTETTTQEIYLPEKYEIVEGVTNAFENYREGDFSSAGAGGVGLPQINRSPEAYKAHESGDIHYIDITTISQPETTWPASVTVDVYNINVDKVFHAVIVSVLGPEWRSERNLFSGNYTEVTSATIEHGKLVVQWKAETRGFLSCVSAFMGAGIFVFLWIVVVRGSAYLIKKSLLFH